MNYHSFYIKLSFIRTRPDRNCQHNAVVNVKPSHQRNMKILALTVDLLCYLKLPTGSLQSIKITHWMTISILHINIFHGGIELIHTTFF